MSREPEPAEKYLLKIDSENTGVEFFRISGSIATQDSFSR
jgi:hypothetical protein